MESGGVGSGPATDDDDGALAPTQSVENLSRPGDSRAAQVKQAFAALDADRSGAVDAAEFGAAMRCVSRGSWVAPRHHC